MRIFTKIESFNGKEPVVLSIGNFDGLHLGHQYLLQNNLDLATKMGVSSVVLSFSPHPMAIFKPDSFCLLSSLTDQEFGLELLGIDYWIIEPFTKSVRDESAEEFFTRLRKVLKIRAIVVGPDFCFGKDRAGDVKFLIEMGKTHNIQIMLPKIFTYKGQRVSSTLIRSLLKDGNVELAADSLGRPFTLNGNVISGYQRGQQLGFPTANINSASAGNLRRGVYSTVIYIRGTKYKAATNVGLHPTFGEENELKVETHILDFNENIYGENIKIEFLKFIRPEVKFSNVESLKKQIEMDLKLVRG